MIRFKAAGIHLLISLGIALIVGLSFQLIYYPSFYFEALDGWRLLLLLIGVDVVLGPLMTLIVFNPNKPKKELSRDISLIGILQISALIYGLSVATLVRPVYTVFDGHLFQIITAGEIPAELLTRAPSPLNVLPKFGPKQMWVKAPTDQKLAAEINFGSTMGKGAAFWPELYEPLEKHKDTLWQMAEPLDQLEPALTQAQQQSLQIAYPILYQAEQLRALPLSGKLLTHYYWAIVNEQGEVLTLVEVASTAPETVKSVLSYRDI